MFEDVGGCNGARDKMPITGTMKKIVIKALKRTGLNVINFHGSKDRAV